MFSRKIEHYIGKHLEGEARQNALDLAAFLRANELTFERCKEGYWKDKRYWYVKFQGEYIGFILVNGYGSVRHEDEPEGWIFWSDNYNSKVFADFPLDEDTKEIAFEHIDFGTCGGGITVKLFGKEFAPVCNGTTFRFDNPDNEAIDCIKKLVSLRKEDILRGP